MAAVSNVHFACFNPRRVPELTSIQRVVFDHFGLLRGVFKSGIDAPLFHRVINIGRSGSAKLTRHEVNASLVELEAFGLVEVVCGTEPALWRKK